VVKNPRSILKNTISNWNRCRRTVSEWPDIVLSSPFKTQPFTLPLSAFSEEFRSDVAKWVDLMTNPDPLDDDAPVRPLRSATIEHRVLQIRQFASALVHRGDLKADEIGLSTLFDPKHFKSALRFFLDRQRGVTTARLHNQANGLRYIAKNHCKLDEATLKALAAITKRLDPGGKRQMTQRNRERLRQFDDTRNVARLLAFPEDQLARARNEKNPMRAAKRTECALAASLMIHCGLRMGTLRALTLVDFSWSRIRYQGVCHLNISKHSMKGNREMEFELPMEVAEIVRTYICEHRKRLPGAAGPFLLPGQNGGKRSRHAIGDMLRRRLLKEAGLVMHPHLFRHAIAKIVVERDPGAYLAVSRVLGHTNLDTTMAHYLGTESKAAARHVDRLLEDAKAETPAPSGKSRARRIGK
jgi:integrase